MTPKQSLLILLLGLFFFVGILLLVRSQQFREKYSLLWIGISLLLLSIPFLLDFYLVLGAWIGIVNHISLLTFFAILTLFLLALQFTLALTAAYHQRKEIAQNVALLEGRVAELEKRLARHEPARSQEVEGV
ncbi:MAG: DUF2304 domain-containing protein [Magnetococcales bacterium]|nr:DUF2304 domain-containing protein [Magnetococcales bacterium]